MTLAVRIAEAMGAKPSRLTTLAGGCVGDVRLAEFADGSRLVVKSGDGDLDIEGDMLRALRERSDLPVPKVLHSEPSLLVMEHVDNDGTITSSRTEQEHAGELFARLHNIGPRADNEGGFGFPQDTLIGALRQPNPWADSWVEFFAERRLIHMSREAVGAGRAPQDLANRVERFARNRLPDLIDEPAAPSLLHGDAWGGNILVRAGRVAACVDPAVYFGHAEVELAFGTLFGTFGERFFDAYRSIRPIRDGFFETRRDVYNLYPLLVHVRLFGGGYLAQVDSILRRFEP
ncbi:MAG: fructosamine kinase family protein [Phycisphaerales bacterium]